MGEVYKAYDSRLERWVAIKRIRGDKNEAAENRKRFQREARATAKLNHSSIVHLYDIFQDGESDCIVMEYVEGKTLDKLIRNGPLEPVQAATLAHEIATGLSEAHSKGIIHRDLKVENVIVTLDGHAKILDFGLARPLLKDDFETSLTGKGQLVGTSRTMSPEYVSGEEIDHRSDLFSLGVLLYEAVTSHSPFRAHNTLATLKQVMLHRQTPAHQVNAQVPEELSAVIENLLEKDPDDRPQSAKEVAQEFGRISGQLSSGEVERPFSSSSFSTTPTEVFSHTPTSVDLLGRRRWLVAIVSVLLIGVVATYGFTRWWIDRSIDPATKEQPAANPRVLNRVVLADFQNHTGEPLLDDSMALAFRLGLEQSRAASVLPPSEVQAALTRMELDETTPVDRELGIEVGQREGARAVVIGAIVKIGETYTLSAEIVDPKTSVTAFATKQIAPNQNALMATLETITKEIRLHLGESSTMIEEAQQPLEKVTTKNIEALKAYSLGVVKSERDEDDDAVRLFKQALDIDPEFAMAHAKIASLYIFQDRGRAEILQHLDSALRLSDRLSAIEKLYVEGWAARIEGRPDGVIEAWSLMSTLYPNNPVGQYNLGLALTIYNRQFELAFRAFEGALQAEAAARPGARTNTLRHLGYSQLALGRFDAATEYFEEMEGPAKLRALADLHLLEARYSEAEELLREGLQSSSRPGSNIKLHLAQVFADQGRVHEALKEAREARDLATRDDDDTDLLGSQIAIMVAHQQLEDEQGFEAALSRANKVAQDFMNTSYEHLDRMPIAILALIGKLNARSGQRETAEAILEWTLLMVEKMPLNAWRGAVAMLEGEVLMARGNANEAIARFEEATEYVGLFQVHESLAQGYWAAQRFKAAIAEYQWLVNHRGLAVVDCKLECRSLNLSAWSLALYRLGQLYEQTGDLKKASEHYQRFIDHWPSAEWHESWRVAQEKLAEL